MKIGRSTLSLAAAVFGLALAAAVSSEYGRAETVVQLAGETFRVEVARTEAERARGLMHRHTLAPDHGMLFIYDPPQPVRFWNKDVRFAIDILYFDAGGRLIRFDSNVPPCPGNDCPVYETEAPTRYVLELVGGTAEAIGLGPGAVIAFR